jgi:hypothetical protein
MSSEIFMKKTKRLYPEIISCKISDPGVDEEDVGR